MWYLYIHVCVYLYEKKERRRELVVGKDSVICFDYIIFIEGRDGAGAGSGGRQCYLF